MVFLMEAHGTNQVLGPASSEFGVWFVGSTFIGSFCCALQYAHICSWGVNWRAKHAHLFQLKCLVTDVVNLSWLVAVQFLVVMYLPSYFIDTSY